MATLSFTHPGASGWDGAFLPLSPGFGPTFDLECPGDGGFGSAPTAPAVPPNDVATNDTDVNFEEARPLVDALVARKPQLAETASSAALITCSTVE